MPLLKPPEPVITQRREDKFLRKYLPGYADYATRVPSTLILRAKQRAVEQCDSMSEI